MMAPRLARSWQSSLDGWLIGSRLVLTARAEGEVWNDDHDRVRVGSGPSQAALAPTTFRLSSGTGGTASSRVACQTRSSRFSQTGLKPLTLSSSSS